MKLKPLALGLALGVIFGLCMLVMYYWPALTGTGQTMVDMFDFYPYYASGEWYAPIAGLAWGFLDGFFFGLFTAWLYNAFSRGR